MFAQNIIKITVMLENQSHSHGGYATQPQGYYPHNGKDITQDK